MSGVSIKHLLSLTPRMKLHHLLQKCSFFLIKLTVVLASGAACMKLHEIQCHFREIPHAVAE